MVVNNFLYGMTYGALTTFPRFLLRYTIWFKMSHIRSRISCEHNIFVVRGIVAT